jgi:deoxyribodipyrimidine photolyase
LQVLADLARKTGAKTLFAHQEVTHEELQSERKVCAALKDAGVQAKFFWGSTLYHIDDLPFKLEAMPSNYAGFREQVRVCSSSMKISSSLLHSLPLPLSLLIGLFRHSGASLCTGGRCFSVYNPFICLDIMPV